MTTLLGWKQNNTAGFNMIDVLRANFN